MEQKRDATANDSNKSMTVLGRKRKREGVQELGGVSEVTYPSPSAAVHGVVQVVSPMKKGKKSPYFDGQFSDGKSTMRLVGFDSQVRRKLLGENGSGKPVALVNCEVKQSRQGLEVGLALGV